MLNYFNIPPVWLFLLAFLPLSVWDFSRRVDLGAAILHGAKRLGKHEKAFPAVTVLLTFLVLSGMAYGVLLDFPNSGDEYVYLFQAETYQQGRLWNQPHPEAPFFRVHHIAQKEGKRVGRYPPGWPLLLAAALSLRFPPGLVNPVLGALSILALYGLARRLFNPAVAVLSALSLLASSFFIFNGASYFSHTACGLLILLFVYCCVRRRQEGKAYWALLAGVFMGYAFLTRYFTAALAAAPAAVYLLRDRPRKTLATATLVALGALPFVFALLYYNSQVTGNPFLLVTNWIDPLDRPGFVKGDLLYGVKCTLRNFFDLVKWGSPAILPLFAFLILSRRAGRENALAASMFLILVAGHFFYQTSGGNRYGPRYYYEGYPFLILTVMSGLGSERKPVTNSIWRRFFAIVLAAGFIAGIGTVPFIARIENRVINERLDLYRLVEREQLSHAVVFLETGTGALRYFPPGDLTRNGLDFDRDVLYAWDRGQANQRLMAYYPGRSFYRYLRDAEQARGRLVRLQESIPTIP